jgi:amino acid adenylation domain-containing protein/FkbH-like protein
MNICIAATFTAEPIEEVLAFWLEELGVAGRIAFAPYGQVFQELLDPASLLSTNTHGANVVLVRFEDWYRGVTGGAGTETAREVVARNATALIEAVAAASPTSSGPILLCLCPDSPDVLADPAHASMLRAAEASMAERLLHLPNVHLVTSAEVLAACEVEDYHDPYTDRLGHVPYRPDFYTGLGTLVMRRLFSLSSAPYKVVVLDCDQTLWKGVAGEDGPAGLELDGGRRVLHEFLGRQGEAGMLLCLCSKNAEADILAVFRERVDFPLRLEHFVAWRINWQGKAANLRELAAELNLGLDSFIFVDDSPLECAEVRAECPEVLVLQLPSGADEIPAWLSSIWAFDRPRVSLEDQQRTTLYRQNVERDRALGEAVSLETFIASLQLEIRFAELSQDNVERVAQLTHRTNQFNLTTVRRQAAEIDRLCRAGELECRAVSVSDRFGDYGLVGVLLFAERDESLEIDTFLLSCRALGRGVEHAMLRHLGELAQTRALQAVVLPFVPTPKNEPARRFLDDCAGSMRHETAHGLRYPVPAEVAVAVQHEPAKQQENPRAGVESSAVTPAPAPPTSAQHGVRSALMQRISDELSRPADVRAAVESRARRRSANHAAAGDATTLEAPRTPAEARLVRIFEEVLRYSPAGVHDDFFDLGGNSLLATQVASRIRSGFGLEVSLGLIFGEPTPARLAAALSSAAPVSEPSIIASPDEGPIPLSFAQERILFLQELDPASTAYTIQEAYRLSGLLDTGVLRRAVDGVVHRHDPLRATFQRVDGEPVQVVANALPDTMEVIDLTGTPEAEREAAAAAAIRDDASSPFDLARGPLLRLRLLRFAADEHVLVVNMHHIVSDGWSMGILRSEISELYDAFLQGRPPRLPEIDVRYSDYVRWQRGWLRGEALERQLAYWREQLHGAPDLLPLPTDRRRPTVLGHRGGTFNFRLPEPLAQQLNELARQHGLTLFQLTLAAFQVLLARFAGTEDVVVGSPIAGRTHGELEPLIGFFANTLVLRNRVRDDESFSAFAVRVRHDTLAAFEHQHVPFERLVDALRPARTRAHSPVFQVMFIVQNAAEPPLRLPGVTSRPVDVEVASSKFDLTLSLAEGNGQFEGRITYNEDLFERASAVRLAESFRTVLGGIVADPDAPVGELQLLDEAEQRKLLVAWNDTTTDYPVERCVHHLFEEHVRRAPDEPAVACDGEQLTHRELNERANALAHRLRRLGVGPDDRVGLCFGRSIEMIVALLGIMKAGAAFVALDPALPRKRLEHILQDSRVGVLVTRSELLDSLSGFAGEAICLDEAATLSDEPRTDPDSRVEPSHLAYVVYTSGSTGLPKGVAVEHRQLTNYVYALRDRLGLVEGASYATVSTLSADLGHSVVFSALAWAGCLHVISEDRIFNGDALGSYFRQHRIDCLKITPSHLAALQDSVDPAGVLPRRWLVLGGESSSLAWVDSLLRIAPDLHVFNHYGPTETTIGVLACRVTADRPETASATVALGKPLSNVRAYIVDARLRPVPVGVMGELLVGGDCVARGYINQPALTAERFIPNPFGDGRVYRTGDRCRYLPDGSIEFLGRIDDQVKIRGFRVEPAEVEAVLGRHPAVRECAVLVDRPASGDARLVAYLSGSTLPAAELRAFLRQSLPDYMVPAAFVTVVRLPLTANGKVDRAALPAVPAASDAEEATPQVKLPRDEVEKRLAWLWADLLGVEAVGIADDFFDLGGNSLHALRLFARIRKDFGVDLPLVTLFEAPTIEACAELIRAGLAEKRARRGRPADWRPSSPIMRQPRWRHLVPVQPHGTRPPFFCVHGVGGDVLIMRELAHAMGRSQPFHAVQADDLRKAETLELSVEEMAAAYLAEIRTMQAEGPYFIGGFSGGGVIAFEMAHQLLADGADLGLLVLLDTIHPAARAAARGMRRSRGRTRRLDKLRTEGIRYLGTWARGRAQRERQLLLFHWRKLVYSTHERLGLTLPHDMRYIPLERAQQAAIRRYVFRTLPGTITLFASTEVPGPRKHFVPPLGWDDWAADGIDVCEVPGNHLGMLLKPNVEFLASELRSRIEAELARRPEVTHAGTQAAT